MYLQAFSVGNGDDKVHFIPTPTFFSLCRVLAPRVMCLLEDEMTRVENEFGLMKAAVGSQNGWATHEKC